MKFKQGDQVRLVNINNSLIRDFVNHRNGLVIGNVYTVSRYSTLSTSTHDHIWLNDESIIVHESEIEESFSTNPLMSWLAGGEI